MFASHLTAIMIALLVLFVLTTLYYRFRFGLVFNANKYLLNQIDGARAADNARMLMALQREIANEFMRRDPDDYLHRFNALRTRWQELSNLAEEAKRERLKEITDKYPKFGEFDILGRLPHVLYSDYFELDDDDYLWELYEDIRIFDALSCELDPNWKYKGHVVSEKERDHLEAYCRRLSDTKLLGHLHKARQQYHFFNNSVNEENSWLLNTPDYMIREIPHFAEIRFGVYIKAMDRYGIWGFFTDEKSYLSFYGANESFEQKTLDTLTAPICLESKSYI